MADRKDDQVQHVLIAFYLNVILLILLVISVPFIEPGTSSYYTALLAGTIVVVSLVLFGYLAYSGKSTWGDFFD